MIRWGSTSLLAKYVAVALVSLLPVAALAFFLNRNAQEVASSMQRVASLRRASTDLHYLGFSLLEMQNSARGFALARVESSLVLYHVARQWFEQELGYLLTRAGLEPAVLRALTRVETLEQRWQAEAFEAGLKAVRQGQDGQPYLAAGTQLMDEIRRELSYASALLGRQLDAEEREVARRVQQAERWAWSGALFTLAYALVASLLLGRTVIRPMRELVEAAQQLAAGQPDVTVPVRSQDEIGRMGDAFNRMAQAITQQRTALEEQARHILQLKREVELERDANGQQRDLYEAALAAIEDGVALIDPQGQQVWSSRRWQQLLGVKGAPTMDWNDVLAQAQGNFADPSRFAETMRAIFGNPDQPYTDLIERVRPTRAVLRRFATPVYSYNREVVGQLLVLRDVTRETDIDRMKNEFIGTVSHELRAPLNSMRGYLQMLLEGDAGPVTALQHEFLLTVDNNARRMTHLINDLLDVEKIEQGPFEGGWGRVDVREVLADVAQVFLPQARAKQLALRVEVPEVPPVWGHRDRLMQVFANLVSNAIKYTQAGSVTITAQLVTKEEGSGMLVSVCDTGVGIPPEHQERIFERFYRVPGRIAEEGTGLGLAIAKAIVERHGGTLQVRSRVDEGTCFNVVLPLADHQG